MLCGCGGGLWGFQSRSIFLGGVILISENREGGGGGLCNTDFFVETHFAAKYLIIKI